MKIGKNNQELQRKKPYEQRRVTKITFMILVSTFLMFFLVGTVNAANWDNVLDYEDNDMKVKFKNMFGLGKDLGTIELKSHNSVTEVKGFGFGKEEVVMYYDFTNWGKYKDGLGEVKFIDMNTGKEVDKDYSFVEWKEVEIDVNDYEEICTISKNKTSINCINNLIGSHKEMEYQWVDYNSKDIPARNIRIGLKTYVGRNDYIDGVWTIVGKKVKKHISWAGDIETDLISYYSFEGDGTDSFGSNDIDVVQGEYNTTAGKVGLGIVLTNQTTMLNASSLVLDWEGESWSFSGWGNLRPAATSYTGLFTSRKTGAGITYGSNEGSILVEANSVELFAPAITINDNVWRYYTLTYDQSTNNISMYVDSVLIDSATSHGDFGDETNTLFFGAWNRPAPQLFWEGFLDEFGFWGGRAINQEEINFLYNSGDGCTFGDNSCVGGTEPPNVTLNLPDNATIFTTTDISMNCTVWDEINLVNVSLILDGVLNETDSSGINNSLYNFDKIMSSGVHNWTCRAANNVTGITTATPRFFNINVSVGTELITPLEGINFTTQTNEFVFNSTPINQGLVFGNLTIWFSNGTVAATNITSLSGSDEVQTTFKLGLLDGNYIWTASTIGSITTNTTINRTFTVHTTPSSIEIFSPKGNIGSFVVGSNLTLNWSITEPGQNLTKHIINCSFIYDGAQTDLNQSQCIEINETSFLYVDGVNNLSFTVLEEFGLTTTNTTSWTFSFLETGVDFNVNVSETSSQTFDINLTTDINVQSISAILTYNGTDYISTASCNEGDCMVSNTLDVPLIPLGEFTLYDFFWSLAIFNGTESSSITTSTRQQNATRIFLEECNATFPHQALNFTTYDEQSLEQVDPYNFDGTLDFWIGGGDVKRNNSFSNSDTETLLCLQPNVTMKIDATINYDEASGKVYTDRFYYFDGHKISNVSQDILMYLLNSSFSTSFILKVQDDSLLPIQDALIETHRFYPGTGEFRIVQIAKTDDAGKSIGFFETETVDYKFIIKKGGEILLETGVRKVVPETSPFTLTFNTGTPLDEPWIEQVPIDDLDSSLIFESSTSLVTYIYEDSSGEFTQARLLVIRQSLVNSSADLTICNETSSLITATLVCNTTFTNGVYLASAFNQRGSGEVLDLDKQFTFQIETLSSVVGLLGLFYGWFLVLIASFMFKFNEIAGIWAVTITVFLINLSGLINFGGVFVTAIIAIAILMTWIMEK